MSHVCINIGLPVHHLLKINGIPENIIQADLNQGIYFCSKKINIFFIYWNEKQNILLNLIYTYKVCNVHSILDICIRKNFN